MVDPHDPGTVDGVVDRLPGLEAGERRLACVEKQRGGEEPLAGVDVRSFSVPASSSVSAIANAAQAAAIVAACGR